MSEAQKKRRDKYRQNRKKLIWTQSILLGVLILLTIISSLTYSYINRTYYVTYTEKSDVNYVVYLKENDYYEDDYVDENHSYLATLIDGVYTDFVYDLDTEEANVYYDYSYRIETQLHILAGQSDKPVWDPVRVIKPETRASHNATTPLRIRESFLIDYDEYNSLAEKFIETYAISDATSYLTVRMHVKVFSTAAAYKTETSSDHTVELMIPLTSQVVDIQLRSAIPTASEKQIACNGSAIGSVFMVTAVVLSILSLLLLLFMLAFIFLTRTDDTIYCGKIKKILDKYKSYIQRINNPFEKTEYQVLFVNTFSEMLEIRETIQAPILMYENDDKTRTEFLIPANTKLLYLFALEAEKYAEPAEASPPTMETEKKASAEPKTEFATEIPEEPQMTPKDTEADEFSDESTSAEEEVTVYPETGVEVVGVVWPEHKKCLPERIYQYDPDGEKLDVGDIVLVPSTDVESEREIVREAEVAESNHFVDSKMIKHPLKRIIAVVRRRAEMVFSSMILNEKDSEESAPDEMMEPTKEH